jgi:hypothetical protein
MSAWMPAPPPESEPAITSTRPFTRTSSPARGIGPIGGADRPAYPPKVGQIGYADLPEGDDGVHAGCSPTSAAFDRQ